MLDCMAKRGDPLIGRRLREARDRIGFTQDAMEEDSGISRSTIAGIESANRPAGRAMLLRLAAYFRVPVDYFTNEDDVMAMAQWILGRLSKAERDAWVHLMASRAGQANPPTQK